MKRKAPRAGSAVLAGGLLFTAIAAGGSPAPATHPKEMAAASVTRESAEPNSDPGDGRIVPKESAPVNPVDSVDTSPGSSAGEQVCPGLGGAAFDLAAESIGALFPAVIADDQVAFQMQSRVCGTFGCHWVTRNHGTWQFLWAHDQTGTIAQQVTMACRPGTNSYRAEMNLINEQSTSEEGEGEGFGINGTENVADPEYSPVVKLTC
jgi:hypothetical protein